MHGTILYEVVTTHIGVQLYICRCGILRKIKRSRKKKLHQISEKFWSFFFENV